MATLVTGGSGFIGSHTCVEMLNAGREIVVVDNYCNSNPEALVRVRELTGKDFKQYDVDVRDREGLRRIFTENNIDSLLMQRYVCKKQRMSSSKHHIKGPKKRTKEDDINFEISFENLILSHI